MIQREWLKHYDKIPEGSVVQSWDVGVFDGSVCTTWVNKGNKNYLISADTYDQKTDTKQAIINQACRYQPNAVLIEDCYLATQLIQELRYDTKLPIIPFRPGVPRIEAFARICFLFEANKVLLRDNASWLSSVEFDLLIFPDDRNSKYVSSISNYLNWHLGKKERRFKII